MLRNAFAASRRRLQQMDSPEHRRGLNDFRNAGPQDHASLQLPAARNPNEADPVLAPLMWIACLLLGIAFWIEAVRVFL